MAVIADGGVASLRAVQHNGLRERSCTVDSFWSCLLSRRHIDLGAGGNAPFCLFLFYVVACYPNRVDYVTRDRRAQYFRFHRR